MKMITLPWCVPIASCGVTFDHLQNEALTVIDGARLIGAVSASESENGTSHR